MIGHRGHPEAEGTMGQAERAMYLVETLGDVAGLEPRNPAKLAYVTQTTLSVDDAAVVVAALKARFPDIRGPKRRSEEPRLNSSHVRISYAVFCLKKKNDQRPDDNEKKQ